MAHIEALPAESRDVAYGMEIRRSAAPFQRDCFKPSALGHTSALDSPIMREHRTIALHSPALR